MVSTNLIEDAAIVAFASPPAQLVRFTKIVFSLSIFRYFIGIAVKTVLSHVVFSNTLPFSIIEPLLGVHLSG
ncbi:MAG TPA: hypothetical protein VJH90_03280 [archaeon]|nr:hypothetical protein [archaeon]